ncbi:type II secretion system GspH family protein [Pseudomonas sp. 21LCFQ02]|uniref:type IV pilus modification PilV family protein n=1 Tax=Pseudomonas sp. 21LCFQ02 TaxID=2957505 RepID=UPI00209AAD29|nr:type II secretion system protein [Pseudomonas sp. 21LCFQ02]MCO8167168.1 type II secretion system GspH family protein [Pseudomonas sp. 21LCFQ02]
MSRSFKPARHRQRGDILLESLIGIVLMSIIGLGMTYATSRAAVAQRDMKVQNIAVSQMRDLISRYGKTLCDTNASLAKITLPTQTAAVMLDASCTNAPNATLGNGNGSISVTPASTLGKVVLTTRSSDTSLFSGIIRVGDEA